MPSVPRERFGWRSIGRAQERRRARGDDQDPARGPPFAIKARTQAANQLQGLRVTAPEQLRSRLRGLSTKELVSVAARFRLADDPSDVPGRQVRAAFGGPPIRGTLWEIAELEAHLDRLVGQVAAELVALPGIGTDSAATLLIVAGDNPQRLGARPPSPVCAGSPPSKPPPARS